MALLHHASLQSPRRRQGTTMIGVSLVVLGLLALAGVGYVGFLMWPRWPGAALGLDAPTLPVTVGDVAFNIPPAAIRVAVQRKSGAHERIDLAFLWPSLSPPDPLAEQPHVTAETPLDSIKAPDRIFVTIAGSETSLSPQERRNNIYPRYLASEESSGPDGLTIIPFRMGSPYQSEDFVFDRSAPERFPLRCSRPGPGPVPGTCLYERRIDTADVLVRFPRDKLTRWREMAESIERLLKSLHPQARS